MCSSAFGRKIIIENETKFSHHKYYSHRITNLTTTTTTTVNLKIFHISTTNYDSPRVKFHVVIDYRGARGGAVG